MTRIVTERPAFQGDVCIRRITAIPDTAIPACSENGVFVVAHSETQHHHIVAARAAQMLIDKTNAFIGYLKVLEPTELRHLRDFDTHAPLMLPPGNYEIRRQREHTPEGWRRAAD